MRTVAIWIVEETVFVCLYVGSNDVDQDKKRVALRAVEMAKNGTLLSCSSVNRVFHAPLDDIETVIPETLWDNETSWKVLKLD